MLPLTHVRVSHNPVIDMKARKTIPMIKTYQYRIYPTIKQAKKLFAWLERKEAQNLVNPGETGNKP